MARRHREVRPGLLLCQFALACCHVLDDEPSMSTCAVVWCDRTAVARGLCKRCYARYKRGVSPVGGARRYATKQDRERLRYEVSRRRESGESLGDIAAAVGVNTTTLRNWLRDWDIEPVVEHAERPRPANLWQPWSREHIEFAISRTDLTIAERAAALGRSVSSIEEITRKYGPQVRDGGNNHGDR
ncbi:helix-turn-helix domain-containing protein [Ancrocorticia sp.]|uniref:helix-turn-helix domain-containing protein n=1 Tax=Ancrocorticia sp. TaxID=2593684 RepID=UPI003F93DFB2